MSKTTTKRKNNTIKLKFDTSWSYAPAPESKSAATIKPKYDLFVNGEWVKPLNEKYFDTINPANEEKLSEVAEASDIDVDKAVKAARNAYEKVWRKMPPTGARVACRIRSGWPSTIGMIRTSVRRRAPYRPG